MSGPRQRLKKSDQINPEEVALAAQAEGEAAVIRIIVKGRRLKAFYAMLDSLDFTFNFDYENS